jgi:hypothetical protein
MTLTARERRLLAIGALVLVVAIAWLAVVRPLIAGFADRAQERDRLERQILTARRLLAQQPIWRMRARRLMADAAAFGSADADAAAARVTDQVLAAAAGQGATVSAVRPQAPGQGVVRISVEMRADTPQLVGVVKALEHARPYLVIQTLSVGADPDAGAGRAGALNVMLDIGAPYVAYSG